MGIENSITQIYPGLGSPTVIFRQEDFAQAATGVVVLYCSRVPQLHEGQHGQGPIRQGKIRLKTDDNDGCIVYIGQVTTQDYPAGLLRTVYQGTPITVAGDVDLSFDFITDQLVNQVNVQIVISGSGVPILSIELAGGA